MVTKMRLVLFCDMYQELQTSCQKLQNEHLAYFSYIHLLQRRRRMSPLNKLMVMKIMVLYMYMMRQRNRN